MPRRSHTQITSELARKIADKLKAVKESRKGAAHDLYVVYENGAAVALFGIRHSSKKHLGHDHIPNAIHVNAHKAKLLGQCPMSRPEWVQELRDKGLIEDE